MKKLRNRNGFTLIEMVVVIAIVAVMATLGLFATGGMIRKSQIKEYTQVAETIAKTINEIGEREKVKETPFVAIKGMMTIENICKTAGIEKDKYTINIALDELDSNGIINGNPPATLKTKTVDVSKKGKPEVSGSYGN